MTFWGTVGAAAVGGLIVAFVPKLLNAIGRHAWRKHTPAGRGYARAEQLVGQILERIPGEIIPPEPAAIMPPAERRRGRGSQITFLLGFACTIGAIWIFSSGSDHTIAVGSLAISALAVGWLIFLSVSLEKRVEVLMADVRRIADAVAPRVQQPEATERPNNAEPP